MTSRKSFSEESSLISPDEREVQDHFKLVYCTFFLMGAGLLFPWNAVITADDLWKQYYPDDENLLLYFTGTYMAPNLLGLLVVIKFGRYISRDITIVFGFTLFTAALCSMPFIRVKGISIALCGVLGFADSIVAGSIYGLAGQLPPVYSGAVMGGNGIAGLFICVLRIITKLTMPDDHYMSGIIYFSVAAFCLLLCIIGYLLILKQSPFMKYHQDKAISPPVHQERELDYQTVPEQPDSLIAIFKMIWIPATMVALNFYVTLTLFPGMVTRMKSQFESLNTTFWYITILITEFNLGDLIGRLLPRVLILFNNKTLAVQSLCRLAFIPLFVFGLYNWYKMDVWMYLIMAAFSITNGYGGTLAMMFGPDMVSAKNKERAGIIMIFCLTFGLTTGVWTGVILGKLT